MMINNKIDNNKINNLQQIQNTKYNLRFFYIKKQQQQQLKDEEETYGSKQKNKRSFHSIYYYSFLFLECIFLAFATALRKSLGS